VLSNGRGPPCGDEAGKFSSSPSTSHEHVRQHQGRTPLGGRTTTKKKNASERHTAHGLADYRGATSPTQQLRTAHGEQITSAAARLVKEAIKPPRSPAPARARDDASTPPLVASIHPSLPRGPRVVPLRLASQSSPRRRRPPLTCAREPIGTQHCPVGQELRRQWACTEAWCPRGSAFCRPLLDVNSRAERQVPAD
jgi:hypothetical protein